MRKIAKKIEKSRKIDKIIVCNNHILNIIVPVCMCKVIPQIFMVVAFFILEMYKAS